MTLLTKQLLNDLGIELREGDYELLAEHFDTTLHDRVIDEIVLELEPEQAQELADMKDANDDELLSWLTVNVKNFPEIVSDEIDILLGELVENSEAINH
jgi:hypothetical protein